VTKAELLDRIRSSRSELDIALARLSDSDMTRNPPDGGWSAKDHLAHLDTWHHILLGSLAGNGGTALGLEPDAFDQLELDDANRMIYERNRDHSLNVVREAFEQSYAKVLQAVEAMSDTELAAPLRADDPRTLATKVDGDSWAHYDEHRPLIEALR
jgi:uncharacterized damage-inducible protein DinB